MAVWRLGIDLGTNSLGWAALTLDETFEPTGLLDWGVRIFPDGREPKSGESLAVARRTARGMRRNRDRRQNRIRQFSEMLHQFGLLVDASTSPYNARNRAAKEKVTAEELGRALFHLCKRRGFLSNRKADGEDKDTTDRKLAMGTLQGILDEQQITLGQFLYQRIKMGLPIRFRSTPPVTVNIDGEEKAVYPKRSMYLDEFATIRKIQGNSLLNEEQWDALEATLAFQRPLKPQIPGRCTFEDAPRASSHLPISQLFRIVQEVNNLRYNSGGKSFDLTQQQKDTLRSLLESQRSIKFSSIRAKLKLDRSSFFNLESERRSELKGNETAARLRKLFADQETDWDALTPDTQNNVVQCILDATNRDDFTQANQKQHWGFSQTLLDSLYNVHFSSSFARLSQKAMQKLLPLILVGKQYWEAATEIYGAHTADRFTTGEVLPSLPYYGEILEGATTPIRQSPTANVDELEYGRIPNPTVHVALNQLRKVVNALIARFGNPYQVHIELARDLKHSIKQRAEIEREITKHTKERERRIKELTACGIINPSAEDLIKMRLWEELAQAQNDGGPAGMVRLDVYTGRPISLAQCMSDEVEIEHILPFSRTYDNTMANKTVTFRQTNREKANNTPAEFMLRNGAKAYADMIERAQLLKKSKRWRFQEDAMDIFERAALRQLTKEEKAQYLEEGADGAFLARQIKDTQYIARIAARYLVPIVGSPSRVIPVNGGITALLRGKWRLNFAKQKGTEDERSDHRHHAVDALVVGLTSRRMLQRIGKATADSQKAVEDYRAKLYVPMPDWLAQAKNRELYTKYDAINVSFRQDHKREGKLYQETAYGILPVTDPAHKEGYNAVTRRAITGLKEKELGQIRDEKLRCAIVDAVSSPEYAKLNKWEAKLGKLMQEGVIVGKTRQFVRRVRILVTNQSIKPIGSAQYKGYATDSLAFCDVWQVPVTDKKRTFTGKFKYEATYTTYADAKIYENDDDGLFKQVKPHPAAKHCMRLFKEDMVTLWVNNRLQLMRVAGFSSTNNRIDLRVHTQTDGKRQFFSINKTMQEHNLQKVHVTEDGRMLMS
ncbi:type II CRISPR RNA-guided endonuclease Cas9 [Oleidesulfovibrio sp.]|uniref:type II CRISPR RNA-guided endonuclease Cas9 n=1 Tax=Oleidesulfovibrio sp. TaxID=2909707 RepID=UPI003A8C546F